MDSIELMMEEHKNIKRMLKVVRSFCFKVLKGTDASYDDLYLMIDFIRNYADKHHHGKEEQFLFNKMQEELNEAIKKTIQFGMLVEHDQGRFFINSLDEAIKKVLAGEEEAKLDVIANAISYANLLDRHIDKEDKIVYKFAKNNLSGETLASINKKCEDFEINAENSGIQNKYLDSLNNLEKKYLV
ncbi:hemerythrin domain-containing protein [Clostridium fungisolvens]|uniref:Hemerythrin-like domain-containing protein n=1 Tax=Clostridium fungisolvens TaxID=1604897 RepID=A0A6V8SCA9_9CLOT|nr:hemerythrin domain-containing protein [Clostridium fungisolvens]GFP74884.1 hypothetical protein bsdtw1_00947 [Clostridium fungisolvens]